MGQKEEPQVAKGSKCYPLHVGGMSLKAGCTLNSMSAKSCDKLRCSACDKSVMRLDNNCKWNDSIVDYLFFRNHRTRPERL
jgi:hypothetical protein